MTRRLLAPFALLLAVATAAKAEDPIASVPPPAGIIDDKQQCVRTCAVPPTFVVDVTEATQAWHTEIFLEVPAGFSQQNVSTNIQVPAGYTLIIENVSGAIFASWTNQLILVTTTSTRTMFSVHHQVPVPRTLPLAGVGGTSPGAFSQPTKIYSQSLTDPSGTPLGSTVTLMLFRYGPATEHATVDLALSGRLVPNG